MQNIQALVTQGWQLTTWYDRVTKRYGALLSDSEPYGIVAHGDSVVTVLIRLDRRAARHMEGDK